MTFVAMPSGLVEAIGAAGAVLTTLCWVPQAAKIIRERDTRAISLPGTALCVIGVLLWLVYGLAIVDGPLIGSSLVTFAMTRRARPTSWRASASIESVTCFCASPPISATICVSLPRSLSKTRWV